MDQIAIGKIRTSHGVKGQLKVLSFSGESKHFLKLKELILKKNTREKLFQVEEVKHFGDSVLIKLKGIESPEEGKNYNGWEIWVPKEFAAPLGPEEYYMKDLIGCEIVNNGTVLGTIIGVSGTSLSETLEVKTETGVYIIPFMNEYIGDVDLLTRNVELKTVWILE